MLSAYDADSHAYWRRGLVSHFQQFSWTQLTLPPRYFSWRIRGNGLIWSDSERETLEQSYDLVVATSMVDLATLRGLVPSLGQIPTLVYFHENQFAYPKSEHQHQSLEPQMVNLYSALCADVVAFNSEFNRGSFLQGVSSFLKKMPDFAPQEITEKLLEKSAVLPVPIEIGDVAEIESCPCSSPCIIWNHRWEYDKGGDRLLLFLRVLKRKVGSFELIITGKSSRTPPKEFRTIEQEFAKEISHLGYCDSKTDYLALLGKGDVVVSTAIHEFQGLAVMEAVSAGCIPLLPCRLSYPEIFPDRYLYPDYLDDTQKEADAASEVFTKIVSSTEQRHRAELATLAESWSWQQLKLGYQSLFQSLLSGSSSP